MIRLDDANRAMRMLRAAAAGVTLAAMTTVTGDVQAMEAGFSPRPSVTLKSYADDLFDRVRYGERRYRYRRYGNRIGGRPIFGIIVRRPPILRPIGGPPGPCCPNSMLVCPLPRHFC